MYDDVYLQRHCPLPAFPYFLMFSFSQVASGVCLSDLSQLVAYPSVELFPLHTQEVVSRLQDATFGGDGPGSIDVVSGHHANSDPCPLALSDGFWYLMRTQEEKTTM